MAQRTLFMETTDVAAEKSAGEITAALVASGASQIAADYDNGAITGLRWTMKINGEVRLFAMPARVDPVYKILRGRIKGYVDESKLRAKARRVAWRQLLRWVLAQLAMVDCGMVEAGEVFFAYVQTESGETIFARFKEQSALMLAAGPEQKRLN